MRFRENDVRKLFEEHDVTVTTIRLKHDGHKVFAFAETSSEEEIQKAIKAMDSKEIHGRRLRVRSSKDKDRNDKKDDKKSIPRKRELAIEDVTRHLVFAFSGFLGRQAATEGLDEEKKGKMELVQEILKEIYELPEDDTLKISRDLELIFLQNNRREIPVPKEETKEDEEETEVKEEPTEADDTTENKEENGAEDETEEVKEEAAEDEIVEEEKDEESALIDELGERVGEMIEDQADQDQEDQVEEEEQEGAEEQAEEVSEVPAVAKSPSRGRGGRGGRGRGGRGRKT